MESNQLAAHRGDLDALSAVGDAVGLLEVARPIDRLTGRPSEPTGETVHVLTWRLLDYDGRELTYGGQQRWLLELAALLRGLGHRVLVHQRSHVPFERVLEPGLRVRGHVCSTGAIGSPIFNLKAHRAIPRDAPVVYMVEDLTFPRCRRRSVVVQHGIWWDGEYGTIKLRAAERLARHAVARCRAAICVDTNFINWYRARWPERSRRGGAALHFVPNFLDPAQWGPQPAEPAALGSVDDPTLTICFPRRSEPRRGIWLMAEVAPKLAARHPHCRFRFVVGSGYATEALRARLAASGMRDDQWTTEVLPFDAMRAAYENSQIVVIPTVCGEGTSLSAIEAMYFGCAVIATWVGGLPNVIHDGRDGMLIPPTAAALEQALERLILEPHTRARFGHEAMRSATTCHGIDRWRASVTPILCSALGVSV